MEGAVDDLHLDIDDLVTGIDAALDGFLNSVNNRRNVFLWNGAAHDLVFDFDALAPLVWLDLDEGMTVLPSAAGLANEFSFTIGGPGYPPAVGDLRRPGRGG